LWTREYPGLEMFLAITHICDTCHRLKISSFLLNIVISEVATAFPILSSSQPVAVNISAVITLYFLFYYANEPKLARDDKSTRLQPFLKIGYISPTSIGTMPKDT
jgi:hypothetical protein